jgi:hypothetical protein
MNTEHKTKLIDTDFGKLEVLIAYNEKTEPRMRVEEGHGLHLIDESECDIELTSIEIVVPHGMAVDILPMLNKKQKDWFINNID